MKFSSNSVTQHYDISAVNLAGQAGAQGTNFLFLGASHRGDDFAWGVPMDAKWGTADCKRRCNPLSSALVALRSSIYGQYPKFNFTAFSTTDKYLLFEFKGGNLPQPLYGWAQLDVNNSRGTEVTLVDWAYDTSGGQIPAGDTGTPEPSTFVLTGFAALALGARGLRRWRTASKAVSRKPKATSPAIAA